MPDPADGPNLLFLFSDQHAERVAGFAGDGIVETPHLDALAATGATFRNCYTPSPICVPARMAMLTGLHPHQQQCWTNDDILSPEWPTWPQALGAAGIHTALIGRMHAMGPDQLRGYAEREIGDHSPNWPGVPRHDLGILAKANDPFRESLDRSGPGQSAYQVLDEATATAAEAWLHRWADANRAAGSARRFALTVGFMLPHAPFVCWPDDYARYKGRVPPPAHGVPENEHPWLAWWRANRDIAGVPDGTVERARRLLRACHPSRPAGRPGTRGTRSQRPRRQYADRLFLRPRRADRRAWAVVEAHGARRFRQGAACHALADGSSAAWVDCAFSEYCTDAVPDWTGGMAVRHRMVRLGRWKLIDYHGYPPQQGPAGGVGAPCPPARHDPLPDDT